MSNEARAYMFGILEEPGESSCENRDSLIYNVSEASTCL